MDRRELILTQLLVIAQNTPGVIKVGRNMEDVTGRSRPAIILHDAMEESPAEEPGRPRGSMKDWITMHPQLYVTLGASTADVGQELDSFRAYLIPAVLRDPTLLDLVFFVRNGGGEIRYEGCGVETAWGERREGRMELKFALRYMLDVAELTGA